MTLCAATLSDFDCHKTFCREARPNFSLFFVQVAISEKGEQQARQRAQTPEAGRSFRSGSGQEPRSSTNRCADRGATTCTFSRLQSRPGEAS